MLFPIGNHTVNAGNLLVCAVVGCSKNDVEARFCNCITDFDWRVEGRISAKSQLISCNRCFLIDDFDITDCKKIPYAIKHKIILVGAIVLKSGINNPHMNQVISDSHKL